MQKPSPRLHHWLQHRGESVTRTQLTAMVSRLIWQAEQKRIPDVVAQARSVLAKCGGNLEEAMFRSSPPEANPAILSIVHYCDSTRLANNAWISAPVPRPLMPSSSALGDPSGSTASLSGCIGDVFWLFGIGAAQPFLAEVFTRGLPERRLPYCPRTVPSGEHVARVIGQAKHFVKLVPASAKRFPFTDGCEHLRSSAMPKRERLSDTGLYLQAWKPGRSVCAVRRAGNA